MSVIDYSATWPHPKRPVAKQVMHAALLPHELFHTLYTHGHEVFMHLLSGGSESALIEWWNDAKGLSDDWYENHPVIQTNPPERRIPLGFHGDDAGTYNGEKTLAVNWGSIVSVGCTLDTRLPFTMVKVKDLLPGFETEKSIYEVLTWSLNALQEGKFPTHNERGLPFTEKDGWRWKMAGKLLANSYVGCWAEMRGDWKWLKEALLLPDNYGSNAKICFKCAVLKFTENVGMRYTNFRRDAPHRGTIYSNQEFMDILLAACVVSPLIFITGFHVTRVVFDILHVLDLGIYQLAVPSAMKELTATKATAWGRSGKAGRRPTNFKGARRHPASC